MSATPPFPCEEKSRPEAKAIVFPSGDQAGSSFAPVGSDLLEAVVSAFWFFPSTSPVHTWAGSVRLSDAAKTTEAGAAAEPPLPVPPLPLPPLPVLLELLVLVSPESPHPAIATPNIATKTIFFIVVPFVLGLARSLDSPSKRGANR